MIKKKDLSIEDKKTWENYVKDLSDVTDKDKDNSSNIERKLRYKFDLHGFTLDDANKKVKEIIIRCVENRYKEILFITGKGKHSSNENDIYVSKDLGKLKFSVPDFIKSDRELQKIVISINDANQQDGGSGAILIKLKNL